VNEFTKLVVNFDGAFGLAEYGDSNPRSRVAVAVLPRHSAPSPTRLRLHSIDAIKWTFHIINDVDECDGQRSGRNCDIPRIPSAACTEHDVGVKSRFINEASDEFAGPLDSAIDEGVATQLIKEVGEIIQSKCHRQVSLETAVPVTSALQLDAEASAGSGRLSPQLRSEGRVDSLRPLGHEAGEVGEGLL